MKKLAILMVSLFTLIPATTTAQTPTAIDGLEVIAERQYATDTENAIDASGDGVFLVSARVYLFDTEDHANGIWETLVNADVVQQDLPEDADYTTTEIDDMGDRATVLSLSTEIEEGVDGMFRTIITQREGMIVTVTAIAGSEDAAKIADNIAGEMIKRDPGDKASIYDGTGKSRFGVWDVFLPADHDALSGLTAYTDKETRPSA